MVSTVSKGFAYYSLQTMRLITSISLKVLLHFQVWMIVTYVLFIPLIFFGFWSILASKLLKYKKIT